MEQQGDGKDFGHHLEMAGQHAGALQHHLQQLASMHGLDAGDGGDPSVDSEGDNMDSDPTDKAFAGKESQKEESLEGEKRPQPKRRR